MHELSIMRNIFQTVEETVQENKLNKIRKIHLEVGELRQIIPESFRFAFQTLSAGTAAEGADLVIRWIPVRLHCRNCGWSGSKETAFICEECGGVSLDVLSGKDIVLTSIEGERSGN